jgi:hypothetical protein
MIPSESDDVIGSPLEPVSSTSFSVRPCGTITNLR